MLLLKSNEVSQRLLGSSVVSSPIHDQYWDKIPSPLISSFHRLVTSYYPIVSTQLSSIERGFYGLLNTVYILHSNNLPVVFLGH